jgi:N-acetylglucosaminyldiphosphoundecaprenol N-acetyl-beta-D-mannosaminyltransferase
VLETTLGLIFDRNADSVDESDPTPKRQSLGMDELVQIPLMDSQPHAQFKRLSLLGMPVNALGKDELLGLIVEAVHHQKRYVIGNHNLHSLYLARFEKRMRQFYSQADFAHVDGMSLILVGRLLGLPLTRRDRTTHMDFLPLLMRRASVAGWRIFYLGSKPGIAEKGATILKARYPDLQIQARHGYFDALIGAHENRDVLEEIQSFNPHILLVGMGMPRQEIWIVENRDRIEANTIFCCGALMDYVAGEIPTPPRWLGQIGFEWLYRLIAEPRRLWRRYLVEPWFVMKILVREFVSSGRQNAASVDGDGPTS